MTIIIYFYNDNYYCSYYQFFLLKIYTASDIVVDFFVGCG